MIEALSKPADQISIDDIKALISSKVPEGEQIEFKEELPAKGDGSPDPWMSGENKIGERAKNEILAEVVAFANAHGGALLLGIKESATKPPIAAKISPIPRCTDLAERLKLVFRDCVEPQLPQLEVFAVPTADESGVIILRVGRSRLAPHRVIKTLICPVRRSDRCEGMTMREIQDMTLNVSRGLELLEKRLSERSERFHQEFDCLKTPKDAFGIRLTASPVGEEIRLDRVFWRGGLAKEFHKPRISVLRRFEIAGETALGGPEHIHKLSPSNWQPRLRAARSEAANRYADSLFRNSYHELHCDGLIELGFVSVRSFSTSDPVLGEIAQSCDLRNDLPIVMFADLAIWADHVRKQALTPAAEYVLEVEMRILGGVVQVLPNPHLLLSYQPTGKLQPNSITFPRYSLIDPDEIPPLMALFERDFWNYMAKDISVGQGFLEIQIR